MVGKNMHASMSVVEVDDAEMGEEVVGKSTMKLLHANSYSQIDVDVDENKQFLMQDKDLSSKNFVHDLYRPKDDKRQLRSSQPIRTQPYTTF